MLPVLLSLGPIKIYTMGVLMVLGLFAGLYYWWKLGRDEHFDEESLFDSFFLGLLAFFVIGRIGYVTLHAEDLGTVYRLFAFLRYPGILYSAGIVGAVASVILFARAKAWDVWKLLDSFAVVLSLILVFGSLGAYLNGSNPGAIIGGHPFPVDLMGAFWYLIAFGITVRVRRNFRFYAWYKGDASVAKDGLAALILTGLTGLYYVAVGFVDDAQWHMGPVSYLSMAGLLLTCIAIITILSRSGRLRAPRRGGKL